MDLPSLKNCDRRYIVAFLFINYTLIVVFSLFSKTIERIKRNIYYCLNYY